MQTRKTVYLDHAASSPLRQQARDALLAYEEAPYAGANPNSLHTMGRQAARALDGARAELARCLGGRIRPADVTFTSGEGVWNDGTIAEKKVPTKPDLKATIPGTVSRAG